MKRGEPNTAHDATTPDGPDGGRSDPLERWDEERRRCPVHHESDEKGGVWVVHGHPEAWEVLHDHDTFASRVSAHLSIPSGMDPPGHTKYRRIVDRYFTPRDMEGFEPSCRSIAREVIEAALVRETVEAQADLGEPCAVRMQCAFMGWPVAMRDELTSWQAANERATRSGERAATAAVAESFARRVVAILDDRRALGDAAPNDATTRLLHERVDGRPLTDEEIVSIVRNWTVGELGSIAAGIGILVHELAFDADLQARLRRDPGLLPPTIDEILRVRGPLVANRRVATRDVTLGGCEVARGDRLRILWPSVNRDERVFEGPGEIRPDRDATRNLLYGAGIHVCPGAPLARLELRVFAEELLLHTSELRLDPDREPSYAAPPKGGFERVYVRAKRGTKKGRA